jgi:hypothetical protein
MRLLDDRQAAREALLEVGLEPLVQSPSPGPAAGSAE